MPVSCGCPFPVGARPLWVPPAREISRLPSPRRRPPRCLCPAPLAWHLPSPSAVQPADLLAGSELTTWPLSMARMLALLPAPPSDSEAPPRHIPLAPVSIDAGFPDPLPPVLQSVVLVEVCAGSPGSACLVRKEVVVTTGVCHSSRHPPPLRVSGPVNLCPCLPPSRYTCHEGREPICCGQRHFSRAWHVVGTQRIYFEPGNSRRCLIRSPLALPATSPTVLQSFMVCYSRSCSFLGRTAPQGSHPPVPFPRLWPS